MAGPRTSDSGIWAEESGPVPHYGNFMLYMKTTEKHFRSLKHWLAQELAKTAKQSAYMHISG